MCVIFLYNSRASPERECEGASGDRNLFSAAVRSGEYNVMHPFLESYMHLHIYLFYWCFYRSVLNCKLVCAYLNAHEKYYSVVKITANDIVEFNTNRLLRITVITVWYTISVTVMYPNFFKKKI